MQNIKKQKKRKKVCMDMVEYRNLKRKKEQVLRAKAFVREAWRVLALVK